MEEQEEEGQIEKSCGNPEEPRKLHLQVEEEEEEEEEEEIEEEEEEEQQQEEQHQHHQQLQHRQRQVRLQPGAEEKLVLQFMDSMHSYLSLFDSLSSTLRQGWLELASARHSTGSARINSSLLDLKLHSAATTLNITPYDVDSTGTQPCFGLRKWVSSEESTQVEDENMQPQDTNSMKSSETAEATIAKNFSGLADDDKVQKERTKSLSVFGILISPKLRATQLSFERALETLVEIANMQSSLLYSFHQLHQEMKDTKG